MNPQKSLKSVKKSNLSLPLTGMVFILWLIPFNSGLTSVSINYDVGVITSSGTAISDGTLLIVSLGANSILDSLNWTSGNSFILNDDKLFAAVSIASGIASGALNGIEIGGSTGFTSNSTKLAAIFINGLNNAIVNYATGVLLNPDASFALTGIGTAYQYGSYRNDSPEKFGATGATDDIGWIVPADGGTYNLSAYSGTGSYTGNDITANLATSSNFNIVVIPEPSSHYLLFLGLLLMLPHLNKKSLIWSNRSH